MNKSQLLLKALYLEATLTFPRFAAKHSYTDLYVAYSKLCRGKLFRRKRKPHTMSEKRYKVNKCANFQNLIVRKSTAFNRHVLVSSQGR